MPREISDIDILQAYLQGVIGRAEHHAKNVDEIAFAVAGAIIWRKDSDKLEVMEHEGVMANVLWVKIDGQRFALSYDHVSKAIVVKQGTTHGQVLASFSNTTPISDVKAFFASL